MANEVKIKADDRKTDLAKLEAKIQLLKRTRKEYKEMGAFIDQVEQEIQDEMKRRGATVGMLNGVPIFTRRSSKAYALKQFADAHPEIYEQYLETKAQPVLNKEKLIADHAALLAPFQVWRFEHVD